MIVPMDTKELARQIAEATLLGATEERDRIIEQLNAAAKLQMAAGDIDGGQILAEAVQLLTPALDDNALIEGVVEGPGDPAPEVELPPVRVTTDDEDARAAEFALAHRPRIV